MDSGSTHRKGMGATSWVIWLVTANTRIDALALNRIHSACVLTLDFCPSIGLGSTSTGTGECTTLVVKMAL